MMLSPKPLSEVIQVMAEAMELSAADNRIEIIRQINRYRNLLYNSYSEFELFNNVFHCICVSDFKQPCGTCYSGITLPSDIQAVEAIWDYGYPLTLHSRWRESHVGLVPQGCHRIKDAFEMAEMFPTERDLLEPSALRIFTEREEDADKCVRVTVQTTQGKETTITFKTISEGWAVSKIKACRILSVSLPPDRVGAIKIAQSDGYVLSEYAPFESVPNYRRFKLNRGCKKTVLVQGVKAFKKIFFDHEIVEVGDDLVIEAAAKYFNYGENTSDGNEIAVGDKWRNEMRLMLNGLIARSRGNAIQDANPAQSYRIRSKSLPGYRKW